MSSLRDTGARYELDEQGETSWADYRLSGDRIFIDHVEAPDALRGSGAAGRLMEGVAAAARAAGEKINPACDYAAAWLKRHPEHGDLMA